MIPHPSRAAATVLATFSSASRRLRPPRAPAFPIAEGFDTDFMVASISLPAETFVVASLGAAGSNSTVPR